MEIESIVITREKNVVLQEFQLPNAGARLSQVLQSTFHISNAISFETEQLEAIFRSDEKSLALYNAISYMLKANVANESSSKFEKLWKALNSIYRYLGNGKPENESQRILRTFLIENESLFTLTKNQVTQLDKDTLREKVRFRDLILNDYDKKNLTVTFLSFIYRYSDHRISKILRETLVYREEFIKDIMSIENVENRFKKLTNVTFLYNDCKENSIANCIYDKVTDYLDSNFNNKTTLDIEVVTFICIKYAYYIRNKIFHAEKHDLSFKFTENKLTEELDWLNKILEILILELIKVNQIWNQSE